MDHTPHTHDEGGVKYDGTGTVTGGLDTCSYGDRSDVIVGGAAPPPVESRGTCSVVLVRPGERRAPGTEHSTRIRVLHGSASGDVEWALFATLVAL